MQAALYLIAKIAIKPHSLVKKRESLTLGALFRRNINNWEGYFTTILTKFMIIL